MKIITTAYYRVPQITLRYMAHHMASMAVQKTSSQSFAEFVAKCRWVAQITLRYMAHHMASIAVQKTSPQSFAEFVANYHRVT